jgi:hypothetical protein
MKAKNLLPVMTVVFVLLTKTVVADLVISVTQVGNDVVATGSGTINLTSLSLFGTQNGGASLFPDDAFLQIGPALGGPVGQDLYSGVSGPTSFGSALFTGALSGTGNQIGVNGQFGRLIVPLGYVSGSSLSGSSTFANSTIGSLGLTPGSYTYTWGTGGSADSLTVNVSAVPEPSSLALLGTFVAGLTVCKRRRWNAPQK